VLLAVLALLCVAGACHACKQVTRDQPSSATLDLDGYIALCLLRLKIIEQTAYVSEKEDIEETIRLRRRRLFQQCVVYITFYQILSALSFVLADIDFPDVYAYLVSVVSIVNLSVNAGGLVTCSSDSQYDYVVQLLITTLYPVVFIFILWVCCQVHIHIKCGKKDNITNASKQTEIQKLSIYLHFHSFDIYIPHIAIRY
jgi:hypothetical protein